MDHTGTDLFYELTKNNVGKAIGIVINGKVISAPTIEGPVPEGKIVIHGDFTYGEAMDIEIALRAGELWAPLLLVEKKIVKPSS